MNIVKEALENVEYALSDSDIKKKFPDVEMKTDKELLKYKNINQLFIKSNCVVLLFLDSENSGHWCCLLNFPDHIEFFDSYGGSPDDVFKYGGSNKKKLGIYKNALQELLCKTNKPVYYNTVKYQDDKEKEVDISTCGRHILNRIHYAKKGLINSDYYRLMMQAKKKYKIPFDAIILYMYNIDE